MSVFAALYAVMAAIASSKSKVARRSGRQDLVICECEYESSRRP